MDEGNSRINVKIKNIEGTEINGIGPKIPEFQLENLLKRVENLAAGDYLVLAGSIPGSVKRFERIDLLRKRGQIKEVTRVTGLPKTKPAE